MSYGIKIGVPLASSGAVADIDTTQRNELGSKFSDALGNEFTYCSGVASCAAGDFVVIGADYSIARSLNTPLSGPVGMAVGALVGSRYGWVQTGGVTPATANITSSSTDKGALFMTSTAGRLTTTGAAGCAVIGAWSNGVSSSNLGSAFMKSPVAPGFTLGSY